MYLRHDLYLLLGSLHLSRRRLCGSNQDWSNLELASSHVRATTVGIPWSSRILSPIHPALRHHCHLLSDLLCKDKFAWIQEAITSFLALKQALTTTSVLRFPDFKEHFTVETDASGFVMETMLAQLGYPLVFLVSNIPRACVIVPFTWRRSPW